MLGMPDISRSSCSLLDVSHDDEQDCLQPCTAGKMNPRVVKLLTGPMPLLQEVCATC